MRKAFAGRRDTGLFEPCRELVAGGVTTVAQRPIEDIVASAKRRGVELELAMASRRARDEAISDEIEHPAHVLGEDELPCPAHQVRSQNVPFGEGAFDVRFGHVSETEAEGPLGACVVLRLEGSQPFHELLRRSRARTRDPLRVEPRRENAALKRRSILRDHGRRRGWASVDARASRHLLDACRWRR